MRKSSAASDKNALSSKMQETDLYKLYQTLDLANVGKYEHHRASRRAQHHLEAFSRIKLTHPATLHPCCDCQTALAAHVASDSQCIMAESCVKPWG